MSGGHHGQAIGHVAIAVRDADEAAATFTPVPGHPPETAAIEGGRVGQAPADDRRSAREGSDNRCPRGHGGRAGG